MRHRRIAALSVASLLAVAAAVVVWATPSDTSGPAANRGAALQSAGALTFGSEGTLFVADAKGASIFAFDVADDAAPGTDEPLRVQDLDHQIAAALGTTTSELVVGDLAVHPTSRAAYLSVHRGRGDDAVPVLVRIDRSGTLSVLDVASMPFTRASIDDAPAVDAKDRRGRSLRRHTVTDLKFHGGKLYVAGLSNEEFASTLRVFSYPFGAEATATSLEIYHGAHGAFETHAPIRSLVPIEVGGKPHIVAGYTCTPLVTFPTSAIADGAHVKGKTVAELGFGNTPLDMLSIEKDGKQWVLVVNSSRSGMKIDPADIASTAAITTEVKEMTAGTPFVALPFGGIQRLAELDDQYLVALRRHGDDGSLSLSALSKRWL